MQVWNARFLFPGVPRCSINFSIERFQVHEGSGVSRSERPAQIGVWNLTGHNFPSGKSRAAD